ncbi:unnamed protein product [Miscanthus lutarioriparius]|uniref:Uncharacterized protein n=1 Tax=Miscanthus lutarioriparius TaxID=422564 RepID=A0A811SA54_9POAL|nr:unnamed protein product [Miscanthus lutarioriparius]
MPRQGMVSSSIDASSALVNDMTQPAAAAGPSAAARDFIHSLRNATCPLPEDVRECFNLLAPYAVSINGSNIRAVRSAVTVVVAEIQALDKSVIEFNRTDGQDYELGPCIKVIHEAANGGKQQLAELDAAGDGNQHLANVDKWYQDVKAKIQKCDYDITDVPRSHAVLKAGIVSGGAGTPK